MGTKIVVGLVLLALAALYFQSKMPDDAAPAATAPVPPKPPAALPEPSPESLSVPFPRTITDAQGRALEGTVIGKAATTIAFRRTADQQEFLIPIARLAPQDQTFLTALRDQRRDELERIAADLKLAGRVAHWHSDFRMAQFEAKKHQLPIYLIFTGPDWCPACDSMERSILNTADFKNFANRRLVLMKILVPPKGRLSPENQKLADLYRVDSYPTVVMISPEGEMIYSNAGGYEKLSPYLSMIGDELSRR